MNNRFIIIVLCFGLLFSLSCKNEKDLRRLRLKRIEVGDSPSFYLAKDLRKQLKTIIGKEKRVRFDATSRNEIVVNCQAVNTVEGDFFSDCTFSLKIRAKNEIKASLIAKLESKNKADNNIKRTHLIRSLNALWNEVFFKYRLSVMSDADVLKRLEKKQSEAQLVWVIEAIAMRRIKGSEERLMTLLNHKNQDVVDQSIGALVALRYPKAVKKLANLVKFSDSRRLAPLIDAIATLGGQQAKDFLEFVADGHRDGTIRQMAKDALVRMKHTLK